MLAKKTWRLRHLLVLLASIALLPIVLAGAWSTHTALKEHRNEVERSALEISRALATAVNTDLESSISSLRTLSYSPALRKGSIEEFYSVAKDAMPAQPQWRAVILTDASGKMLFTTGLPYGSQNAKIADPVSLERIVHSKIPVVGSVLRGPMGYMAYPVRIPVIQDGSLAYVLSAAVKPDRVIDIIKQQKVPSDWIIAVFDSSGAKVARTKDHANATASPSLAKLMGDGRLEGIGPTTTLEGVKSLTAFTRISNYGWVVAIGVPDAYLNSSLMRSMFLFIAGILVSVIGYILIAGYLARSIIFNIDDLRDQAVSLVHGSKPLSPRKSRIREVNQMGEALHSLSRERAQIEADRSELLSSLNAALDSARSALAKAEDAAKAKDVFLSMLGHELRNPLAPIVAALDLMDIKGETANLYEREILRRQVDHLRRLVDDLLDVSRIVQGKLSIQKKPICIREVVQQALDAVRDIAEKTSTDICFDSIEKNVWINGDAARLSQVMTNLLTNAIKFAAGGDIRVQIQEQPGQVSITVSDNGIGIDRQMMDDIFQPFFQAPQSIARTDGGLGLGLAIVKNIVELHDGSVRASSEGLNKGSRFEITLPLADNQADISPYVAPAENAASRKIMIVDDNVDAARLIAAGLNLIGHETQTASSAHDALTQFGMFMPEVVILDIGMPDMDGYELARAIRTQYSEWGGSLIALTGYGQSKDQSRAFTAGFSKHLTKPISINELSKVLE